MSTDLPVSVPAPEQPSEGPATPTRTWLRWTRWIPIAGFIAVLFVELGPWPGTVTNTLGLSVSSRKSWHDDLSVRDFSSPGIPSYLSGPSVNLDDAELAEFVSYCEQVRKSLEQLQHPPVDYAAIRDHLGSLMPQLYLSLMQQRFTEENAVRWVEFLQKSPPPRSTMPSGFRSFYEDLRRASVLRQLKAGHLKEMIRYIDSWRAVVQREDVYRRDVRSVANHVPSSLWPEVDLRVYWPTTGLDRARQFMVDKLERGDKPPTESGEGGEDPETSPIDGAPSSP